jgi:hypothetical protein
MKTFGRIVGGPYSGQDYQILGPAQFPRWFRVHLAEESGRAVREVREKFLEKA